MKVIKRVEPPNKWPREFVCEHCRSQLEVDAPDVMFPGPPDRGENNGWFTCPVCLRLVYLSSKATIEAGECLRIRRAHGGIAAQ